MKNPSAGHPSPSSSDPKSSTRGVGKYQPQIIEPKWQKKWAEERLYEFSPEAAERPYYTLVELPYPSGDLHLGHWYTFVPPDIYARYKRMRGLHVFYPIGFDAFGLPAENAAIKRGTHPKKWTYANIENMTGQFRTMGTMIDWSSKTVTSDPSYYRWNQWIFIQMFERGIAYRGKTLSNWCPVDQTVLANEHVEEGKCWRCGAVVEQKEVEQWFLKITDYAERLLWPEPDRDGLSNGVDWPQSVRDGQNNWIGKSEGAEVTFGIENSRETITVFTTRPDTLYGVTFMVLAPEHPLVPHITRPDRTAQVEKYVAAAKTKTERERKEMREKTGVFTGAYAVHPMTKERVPIWIAEYVLWGYGTGAIMAVPAHDDRDHEFAKKHDLPIIQVIRPVKAEVDVLDAPYNGSGTLINSGDWNNWQVPKEIGKVVSWLEEKGLGKRQVNYHLHDWSVSRQRYWGTPVPMIHCPSCGIVPVPLEDLPVTLPDDVDYTPKGKPPLATADAWLRVSCPTCGREAKRDAETLDTFFDSSWYYYRYMDPEYEGGPFRKELAAGLMPLDIYFGGAEHTLGHTLYARFFTKFFHDIGLVTFEEFAKKRVQHGIILGPDGFRMSKSRGNVVNPDDVVREYGADTVRLYLAFMMPYDATAPWNPSAISGVYRFLKRIWQLYDRVQGASEKVHVSKKDLTEMHKAIKKVGDDLEQIKFNTAVAVLMEWLNHLSRREKITIEEYEALLLLLAPFAPHMTDELWGRLGHGESIHTEDWPVFDPGSLTEEQVMIVVQVNGKVRDNISVSSGDTEKETVEKSARESANTKKHLDSAVIKNVIYVPGKLINFVVA